MNSQEDTLLVGVDAPHFCAAIIIDGRGICTRAAPILQWCIGKHRDYLRRCFKTKGWDAYIIPPHPPHPPHPPDRLDGIGELGTEERLDDRSGSMRVPGGAA